MIVPNGYIKITIQSCGGFIKGKPQRAKTTTTGYIEANVNESRRSHGVVGDQTAATKAAYIVLVDSEQIPTISDADSVEIFDSRKTSLGTFEIQSARLLDYVDAIKIEV